SQFARKTNGLQRVQAKLHKRCRAIYDMRIKMCTLGDMYDQPVNHLLQGGCCCLISGKSWPNALLYPILSMHLRTLPPIDHVQFTRKKAASAGMPLDLPARGLGDRACAQEFYCCHFHIKF